MDRNRIFTIIKEDLIYFPPALSLIRIFNELNYDVIHLGQYSDIKQKEDLSSKGVIFVDLTTYHSSNSLILKLKKQIDFKYKVKMYLKNACPSSNDYIWIFNAETICLLSDIVGKYKTILHFFEFQNPVFNWKYGLLNPFYNYKKTLHKAEKVIHCEPNRAQLTQALYELNDPPLVIPNKPYVNQELLDNIPNDIKKELKDIYKKIDKRKVILYQGIFSKNERRLDEFCDAILELPEEFMLVVMGKGGEYIESLKLKYKNERILFLPFMRPPYHLLVTQKAYIGVLSYFYTTHSLANSINITYCAPNKIFEYGKYGVPMISNHLQGLYYPFKLYNCGVCIKYPMNVYNIKNAIMQIDSCHNILSQGSLAYYKSVNLKKIVSEIVAEK